VVPAGASQVEVEVEPYVLLVGAGAEVGGEPTAAMNADAGAAVEVGSWSSGGTPSGTSEGHYRMEQ
jgi:hypothetical protein